MLNGFSLSFVGYTERTSIAASVRLLSQQDLAIDEIEFGDRPPLKATINFVVSIGISTCLFRRRIVCVIFLSL